MSRHSPHDVASSAGAVNDQPAVRTLGSAPIHRVSGKSETQTPAENMPTSDDTHVHIHHTDAFTAILQLERSRSDRSGDSFALITFSFDDTASRNQFLMQLPNAVRVTDHVGTMGEAAAVILWHTTAAGAWSFVDKIADLRRRSPCRKNVYVYPEPKTSNPTSPPSKSGDTIEAIFGSLDQEFGARPTLSEDSPAMREARIERTLVLTDGLVRDLMRETSATPVSSAEPLDYLLARPVPIWKRATDITGAVAGLILLSPLFVLVSLLIKVTCSGPIIFRQQRCGLGGRPFEMLKFRTMVVDAERRKVLLQGRNELDGPAFRMEHDPRLTSIGRLLRRTGVDELPQLWNVLKGEMSLVGPRPLPCDEASECEPWQKQRMQITPGITCLRQVNDQRTKMSFEEWARLDIHYASCRTPRMDLSLIVQTLKKLFSRTTR